MGKIIKNKNILVGSGKFFDLFVCGSSSIKESKCEIEEKLIEPAANASDEEWEDKGRLRKGYKYSGKKLKNGLPQILKVKK